MKKILGLLIIVLMASCWNKDTPTPPRELAQGVYQEEVIKVPDSVMQWSVKEQKYIKVMGFVDKVVPVKEFEVVPNGDQVAKFADLTGQIEYNFWGFACFSIFLGLAIFAAPKAKDGWKGLTRVSFIVLAIGAGFFSIKPANIAQNNAKTITEKQLKHYQSIDPELNYFWDSIYNANKLIGASKK